MLDIKPLTGALGAEVGGIDFRQKLNDGDVRTVRELLNSYEVIFFGIRTSVRGSRKSSHWVSGPCKHTQPMTRLKASRKLLFLRAHRRNRQKLRRGTPT